MEPPASGVPAMKLFYKTGDAWMISALHGHGDGGEYDEPLSREVKVVFLPFTP